MRLLSLLLAAVECVLAVKVLQHGRNVEGACWWLLWLLGGRAVCVGVSTSCVCCCCGGCRQFACSGLLLSQHQAVQVFLQQLHVCWPAALLLLLCWALLMMLLGVCCCCCCRITD